MKKVAGLDPGGKRPNDGDALRWSDLENENRDEQWLVTPFLRRVLEKHRDRLERP